LARLVETAGGEVVQMRRKSDRVSIQTVVGEGKVLQEIRFSAPNF